MNEFEKSLKNPEQIPTSPPPLNMTTKDAIDHLSKVIKDDPEYAWGWHCSIACCAMDEGLDHEHANKTAGRFMHICFGVNTINHENSLYKGE